MVTIEIRNAGTAETGRQKLIDKIGNACKAADELGLEESPVRVDFKGDLLQRKGPLDIQINFPGADDKQPAKVEARRNLARKICEIVKRYHEEHGHTARPVRVTIGEDVSCQF